MDLDMQNSFIKNTRKILTKLKKHTRKILMKLKKKSLEFRNSRTKFIEYFMYKYISNMKKCFLFDLPYV